MTEEVKTVETTEEEKSLIDQVTEAVKDAIKSEGKLTIDQIIATLKEKLTAEGIEFTEQIQKIVAELVSKLMEDTQESVSKKVESFLEEKKDQWAAMAVEDPDDARRKLRTFWLGISAVCFVAGLVIGVWVL